MILDLIFCLYNMFSYSRLQLLNIMPSQRLSCSLWRNIVQLGISLTHPTRRGCCSGTKRRLRYAPSHRIVLPPAIFINGHTNASTSDESFGTISQDERVVEEDDLHTSLLNIQNNTSSESNNGSIPVILNQNGPIITSVRTRNPSNLVKPITLSSTV